jgi:hypothetical protein
MDDDEEGQVVVWPPDKGELHINSTRTARQ